MIKSNFELPRYIAPLFSLLIFITFSSSSYAQNNSVAIGSAEVRDDAVLWLVANGQQGLVLPITTRSGFTPSEEGMLIYDSSDKKIYYWNATAWIEVGGSGGTGGTTYGLTYDASIGSVILVEGGTGLTISPTLSGDISGNLNATQIEAGAVGVTALSSMAATNGQILEWDSGLNQWKPVDNSGGGGTDNQTIDQLSLNGTNLELSLEDDGQAVQTVDLSSLTGSTELADGTTITGDGTSGNEFTVDGSALTGVDAVSIDGQAVDLSTVPTDAQVLKYDGPNNQWIAGSDDTGSGAPILNASNLLVGDGASNSQAAVGGDLTKASGTASFTVVGIQGQAVNATTPIANQVLQYNAGQWAATTLVTSGDMTVATYDPTSVAADVFDRANHAGTQTAVTISDFNTAADARIAAASVTALSDVTSVGSGDIITSGERTILSNTSGTNTGDNIVFSNGTDGLVPDPGASSGRVLQDDGTWVTAAGVVTNDANNNIFGGTSAGTGLSTGADNVMFGREAGLGMQTGNTNVVLGTEALRNSTNGAGNVAIGDKAMINSTSGTANVAVGLESLGANTTGSSNVGVGEDALNANTIGANNTAIGAGANVGSNNLTNATAIGAGAIVGASDALVLGGTGASAVNVGIGDVFPASRLTIRHGGTGSGESVDLRGDGTRTLPLVFWDVSETNFAGFQAPPTVNNPYTLKLPDDLPSAAGQVMTSDLMGNLSWSNAGGSPWTVNGADINFPTGNVGIGTITPAHRLDVDGNMNVSVGNAFLLGGERFLGGSTTADNVFVGGRAGNLLVTGSANVMVGTNAGAISNNTVANTIVGNNAALSNTTGGDNTFFGSSSGGSNTTGNSNTFIGLESGLNNLTGSFNTMLGSTANTVSDNLSYATAIGAGASVSTNNTVRLGRDTDAVEFAGQLLPAGPGSAGTLGQVLTSDAAGLASWQTSTASPWNVNGSDVNYLTGNVGIGTATPALTLDVAGEINALNSYYLDADQFISTNGVNNSVFLGVDAGHGTEPAISTHIGFGTGTVSTGGRNTFVGHNVGSVNTIGDSNAAVGASALEANTTGTDNVAIGVSALDANTTGTQNVAIGADANVGSPGLANATAIGNGAIVNSSNSIQLGSNFVTTVNVGVGTTATLVAGGLQITGGTPALGQVLTSDATGLATWQVSPSSPWAVNSPDVNFIGGKVGIGIAAPAEMLHVNSPVSSASFTQITNSGTGVTAFDGLRIGNNGDNALLWNFEAGSLTFGTANLNMMTIATSGRIGIGGITAPNYTMQVQSLTGDSGIQFTNPTSGQASGDGLRIYQTTTGGSVISNGEIGSMSFGTDDTPRMTIDASGNVGIGTTSPHDPLHVDGGTSAGSIRITNDAIGATATDGLEIDIDNTGEAHINTGETGMIVIGAGGNNVMHITSGGLIGLNNSTPTAGLDLSGTFRMADGSQGVGKVLTSVDATGLATWQAAASIVSNDPPNNNIFGGTDAGMVTTGTNNTIYGENAGSANTTGFSNSVLGSGALGLNTTGSSNTAVGTTTLQSNTTGSGNTAVGNAALSNNTIGANNVAMGTSALSSNTTGSSNVAIGEFALLNNTTGGSSTAVGSSALSNNSTGANNSAMGNSALFANTTGGSNTAVGSSALQANTTGGSNTAVGSSALLSNTTGGFNTAVGRSALAANSGGDSNVAMGYFTLTSNTTGGNNTAIGRSALTDNTVGFSNVAIGNSALQENTTGTNNTAVGSAALLFNTTGINNVAMGSTALAANTTGGSNTAVGTSALEDNTTGGLNTAVGTSALRNNTTGINNVAMGASALFTNSGGDNNTAIGLSALRTNSTGFSNVAMGRFALFSNTTGSSNVAMGVDALQANTTGTENTAVGTSALNANTGIRNVAMGSSALRFNTTGRDNAAMGYEALRANTEGDYNVAVGTFSLYVNTMGSNNVAMGDDALRANTIGSNNVAVGHGALDVNTTGTNNVAIGSGANVGSAALTNATAIGYNAIVDANDALVLGGTGADAVNVGIGTTTPNPPGDFSGTVLHIAGIDNTGIILEKTDGPTTNKWGLVTGGSGEFIVQDDVGVTDQNGFTMEKGVVSGQLYLQDGGNVGIGTSTPDYSMEVVHSESDPPSAGAGFTISNTSNFSWTLYSAPSKDFELYYENDLKGSFNGTSGVYMALSDRRLKKNIADIPEVLVKLMTLPIKEYHFKTQSDSELKKTGVIAQEIKEIFPSLVNYSEQQDIYTVNIAGLAPLAVKAIQEQQVLIENQEARIAELEKHLAKTNAENASFKASATGAKSTSETETLQTQLDAMKAQIDKLTQILSAEAKIGEE